MLPYWLLFFIMALPAAYVRGSVQEKNSRWSAFVVAVLVILLIGLRYQVGSDWYAYLRMFNDARYLDVGDVIKGSDPAFTIINWLVSKAGVGYWLVNLVCGAIFAYGLFRFSFNLPNPWLALAVAAPYLVIVVAMGYSRQGVAISLVMLGLLAVKKQSFGKFIFWTLAAAAFHKTAIIALPIVALSYSHNRILVILGGILLTIVGYYLFLSDSIDVLMTNYIDTTYESEGAAIRICMNAIPAFIYLVTIKKFPISTSEKAMWRNFSIIAVLSVPLVFQIESTTALDRLALYLIPIQLFVFSWIPQLFSVGGHPDRKLVILILLYAAAELFVWLNFATHAQNWLPYTLYPLAPGWS